MHRAEFIGTVHPTIVSINVETSTFPVKDMHFDGEFSISITNNALAVRCSVTRVEGDFLSEVFRRAFDCASGVIDMLSFCEGMAITLIIDRWIDPNGCTFPLILHQPEIGNLCSSYGVGTDDFLHMFNLMLAEPEINMILRDVAETTMPSNRQPASYARAIEGIRHLITPSQSQDRKKGWATMQLNLNVTHAYLSVITDHSKPQRHGQNVFIPLKIMEQIVVRSRTVVDRFFSFRLGGNKPLVAPRFPLLDA